MFWFLVIIYLYYSFRRKHFWVFVTSEKKIKTRKNLAQQIEEKREKGKNYFSSSIIFCLISKIEKTERGNKQSQEYKKSKILKRGEKIKNEKKGERIFFFRGRLIFVQIFKIFFFIK